MSERLPNTFHAQVLEIPEAHSRPVHSLRLHEGSAHSNTPAGGHDLLLTSAIDNVVKLWDLRSSKCVRRFEAHANRVHSIGASLSPCLRFVCSGSEDKFAYLYDARSGSLIDKLRHAETVTDSTFSPLFPQLAAASLSGHVRFYTDCE